MSNLGAKMPVSRRDFLKTGAAAGALLLARPWSRALGATLGPDSATGASRTSRLFPGTTLVHADLHNHSLLSDGDGNAANAFGLMRAAGLDVAALTDHSTLGLGVGEECGPAPDCSLVGINEDRWLRVKELADAANADDSFVAIRGFEWSSPTMGHINVWFSERWIDPLHTGGGTTGEGAAQFLHQEMPGADAFSHELDEVVRQFPSNGTSMKAFYTWLRQPSSTPGGGGLDGIAGFNHPGREQGRFGYFAPDAALEGQLVSLELFNRREDYIYEGTDEGFPSPLVDCLDKGWKVGLLGVTDEHGTDWGTPLGKGRAGIYVNSLTREGVKQGMKSRRFFATRERGLRVDAAANGVPMGSSVQHTSGTVHFQLDIDGGGPWYGRPLSVQVLRSGSIMPTVSHVEEVRVPVGEGPNAEPVISFDAPVNAADGEWVVLRISDPSKAADGRANDTWKAFGDALAYTSPFFLQP